MVTKRTAIAREAAGFTLIELLVSMTVLIVIMSMIVGIVDQTSKVWRQTTAKISEFQDARSGFETISRVLGQSVLNTYTDYVDDSTKQFLNASNTDSFRPSRYARQSQLHFVSGTVSGLLPSLTNAVTHAVFLQAPLGYTTDTSTTGAQGLGKVLNACGYYVQFGPEPDVPDFLKGANGALTVGPVRNRFRLYEFLQPTEKLTVYDTLTGTNWFASPGTVTNVTVKTTGQPDQPPTARPLAENIVALVILPQKSVKDDATGTALCPTYSYDSRANAADAPQPQQANQLPPLVSVAMIAVDEPSAVRFLASATDATSAAQALGYSYGSLFTLADNMETDLQTISDKLASKRINYRVFRTKVSIRAARWSNL